MERRRKKHVDMPDDIPLQIKKEIESVCERLKNVGRESLFLCIGKMADSQFFLGSDAGLNFLNHRLEIVEDFYKFCDGKSGYMGNGQDKQENDQDNIEQFTENEATDFENNGTELQQSGKVLARYKRSACELCGLEMLERCIKRHMMSKHAKDGDNELKGVNFGEVLDKDKNREQNNKDTKQNHQEDIEKITENVASNLENNDKEQQKENVASTFEKNETEQQQSGKILSRYKRSACKVCGLVMLERCLKRHMMSKHNKEDNSEIKGVNSGKNPENSNKKNTKNNMKSNQDIDFTESKDFKVGKTSGYEIVDTDKAEKSINTRSRSKRKSDCFTCDVCQETFSTFIILKEHIEDEHGEEITKYKRKNNEKGTNNKADKLVIESSTDTVIDDQNSSPKNGTNQMSENTDVDVTKTNINVLKAEDDSLKCLQFINCKFCNLRLYKRSLKRHMLRRHRQNYLDSIKESIKDKGMKKQTEKNGMETLRMEKVHDTVEGENKRNDTTMQNIGPDNPIYWCKICGYKYISEDRLNSHLKEKHHARIRSDISKDVVRNNHTQNIPCSVCGLCFTGEDYNIHLPCCNINKGDKGICETKTESDETSNENDVMKIKCHACSLTFAKNDITMHLKSFHGITNVNTLDEYAEVSSSSESCINSSEINVPTKISASKMEIEKEETLVQSKDWVKCSICDMMMKEKHIRRHLERHRKRDMTLTWKFYCPDCGKGFMSNLKMKVHQRAIHKRMNLFKCTKCSETFHTTISLRNHLKVCDGQIREENRSKKFPCPECLRMFRSEQSLKCHLNKHVKGHWICIECGMICRSSNALVKHRLVHQGAKSKFSCFICDSVFRYSGVYSLHLKNVHKNKRYIVCKFCGDTFHQNSDLEEHAVQFHNKKIATTCRVCNITFGDAVELKLHSKTHKTGFICELCGKEFSKMSRLESHKASHSDEKPFKCEHCNKSCKSKHALRSHMKVHNIEFLYQCEECGKRFKRVECLKGHRKTHQDDYRYKCKQCIRQFRSPEGLKSHILAEHPQSIDLNDYKLRYYKCEYCSKVFAGRQMYTRHVRSQHTGYKPFDCDLCDAKFTVAALLNRHKKESHMNLGKDVKCEICDVDFKGKSKYRRHLKSRKHQEALNRAGLTSEEFEKLYPVKGRRRFSEQVVEVDCMVTEADFLQSNESESSECIILEISQSANGFTLPISISNNQQIMSDIENVNAVCHLIDGTSKC